jgi:hypothetical protein
MLPNMIEKAFERDGGHTLYRRLVDEILIKNGQAYGVRLQDGMEILAKRVIANATVWNIYGRLVRLEHISPKRLEWSRSLVPTFPSMTLYMVVDRQGIPANTFPWEIYIENREEIDSSDLTLYINSMVDSTLCPPDELVVMAIAPNMEAWPRPDDPGYRSAEYEEQKQREAGRMLDQIEQHIPGFRQHIRSLIIGTPTTIERYLMKNGGAVGGPKNQIGQEMLKRLHARSEWKNLYICGDSTTMGTGAPATAVSGVGAANVILRELHLKEYDPHPFSKQYVNLVELPYRHPDYTPADPITEKNAPLAAAHCQGCQEPACVDGCPVGIDIPGFLRRMEAGNYTGAARLIRAKNPFGEVCGLLCATELTCQRDCYRRDFTGKPVRIAELQRWVCSEAGDSGWLKIDSPASGPKVAVIGAGPSALSCAWYLSLAGCRVSVFATEEQPGGVLWRQADSNAACKAAVANDLQGVMSCGITFRGGLRSIWELDLDNILENYSAVYLTDLSLNGDDETYSAWLGQGWRQAWDRQTGRVANHPEVFFGEEFRMTGLSIVEAVAQGRLCAMAIQQFLGSKA